jgi:hypothetical protein
VADVVTVTGRVIVSLPSNVPLKGTWCCAAGETASGDAVEDAPIDDAVEGAPIDDGTDVGLVGDVVRPHPTNTNADPVSTTMAAYEARIETPFVNV